MDFLGWGVGILCLLLGGSALLAMSFCLLLLVSPVLFSLVLLSAEFGWFGIWFPSQFVYSGLAPCILLVYLLNAMHSNRATLVEFQI